MDDVDIGWQQSQFLPELFDLPSLKRIHSQPPPFLRDSDQSGKGQLQTTLFIKEPWDYLASSPLLSKRPFQQIRRPDGFPMPHRTSQVIRGGLQILFKGFHRRGIKPMEVSMTWAAICFATSNVGAWQTASRWTLTSGIASRGSLARMFCFCTVERWRRVLRSTLSVSLPFRLKGTSLHGP